MEYDPGRMRRISTKLVLLVLLAVALPFLGFAVYMDQAVTLGFTRRVTQQALLGLSGDLAGRLDRQVAAAREGVELLAGQPFLGYLVESVRRAREGDATEDPSAFVFEVERAIEARQRVGGLYELLLLVDADGRFVTAGSRDARGEPFTAESLAELAKRDFGSEPWFRSAMEGQQVSMDQHRSELFPGALRGGAADYFLGLAEPVGLANKGLGTSRPDGVLFALVSWAPFQGLIESPLVRETFRGLVREGQEPSPYAWIWSADADHILAHKDQSLYGTRIIEDLDLGIMTSAVLADSDGWGMYPPYSFRGVEKTAAYKRCVGPDEGGFGWVVGVGIDDVDMYASAKDLRRILRGGTVAVILVVLLWTMVIARRMTSPIHALQDLTRRVADGDFGARLEPTTNDELGELTRDFNAMTEHLGEQREQLVKAEKDAAWREMARQIAHDIKNPLTPIKLSVDLLRRSHAEDKERFEELFGTTMDLMDRQIVNLRAISQEFYEFTGGRKSAPERFDAAELAEEVVALHAAWAEERHITLTFQGSGALFVDRAKLRRVFENLVTNALFAVGEGGHVTLEIRAQDGRVHIELRDDGVGISAEAREHLFEPYFTTRGEGTGLGLAIAWRVIEEMGGRIALVPRSEVEGPGTRGTLAQVELPEAPPA